MQPSQYGDFHPENIPTALSHLRPDGHVPVLNDNSFYGGQCHIFKADFPDGECWAVRIPLYARYASRDGFIIQLEHEAKVLRELELKGFRWAPKLKSSSLTFENVVGYPFLALSWVQGTPLSWSEDHPPRSLRNKVLGQVALIQEALIECTKEKRGTATKFFERVANNRLYKVRNGDMPDITEQDCFEQKSLLPEVLYPSLDDAPFALDHDDLLPSNIIIDEEHNVVGIVDWGFAAKVPMQLAAGLPRFLYAQPPDRPPSQTLQEDRKVYLASLASRSSQAASWMSFIQSAEAVDFRTCFLESLMSKGMHAWLARRGWKISHSNHPSKDFR
ncbi:hypothetical protein L228DRAFT_232091 [Xylona heveae TC161]|uniref:Aminoglycoside phosphotransferase domain-containing protein n=1 Tax=Xylona heveae (strain CBS 132557 / TC161) TaxID=1328760 RepID=A0A165AIB2_XYLHT|nr:hypothetical protein L228DRAFT_232091 [Xylona heveae TC161]KZF20524.1 hypothetical protein L228DRAFT_232091 [Xylona heveae TC161]